MSYEHEARWRARWEADGLHTFDVGVARAEKFYNLVEFPYPSADGLHVGHARTYSGADTFGRYRRMRGSAVFQPMGFDSFGINAENYALRAGEHPRRLMDRTTVRYREQLERLGGAWDWSRQMRTSDPEYYRWTQWLFVTLYRAGLAYRAESPVVWCPSCLTVLAFEQLEGDACERCGTPVTERVMRQWFLRITAYADALADGLDALDWPEWAKRQQRDWIGRSPGAEVDFEVSGIGTVTTFTTRADTLYGVTFLAVSAQSWMAEPLARAGGRVAQVEEFVRAVRERAPRERFVQTTDGVDTGARAVHPLTGESLPVFVADYVVAGYGTGAVMGVPAHDERDHAFAVAHGLPIVRVIEGGPLPYTGEGRLVSSRDVDGLPGERARARIVEALERSGRGRPAIRYRMHDWLISRQRYWGPPIPIVYCDGCGEVPVPESELPVPLPDVEDFRPTGTGLSPLAGVESFVRTTCPSCGAPARRETDVSDTFVDSSWYFLRYPCTDVTDAPWSPERVARLLPVDQYEGGREHVTRHHLYARFVCHALNDLGLIEFTEPFPRIRYHGLIVLRGAKMSKSRGNVVNPDDYLDEVGADNLRMALLFCGPWESGGEFGDEGVQGIVRFTTRLRRLIASPHDTAGSGVEMRPLHRYVDRVGRDIDGYRFNTAIASLMETVRWAGEQKARMSAEQWRFTARSIVLLLAPFAPHLAEELWSVLGEPYSVHRQPWPEADPDALAQPEVDVVVQVDGRVRDVVRLSPSAAEDEARSAALESDKVRRALTGAVPRRVVYVPGKVLNLLT